MKSILSFLFALISFSVFSQPATYPATTTYAGYTPKLPGTDEVFYNGNGEFSLPNGATRTVVIQPYDSLNNHWRNDLQTMIFLHDSSILTIFATWITSNTNDAGNAQLDASVSSDGGITWSSSYNVITKPVGIINIQEPSLYQKQGSDTIFVFAFMQYPGSSPLQSTIGKWQSTDNGATFSFVDSLLHGLGAYIYPANNRIIRSPNTGRLFLPINFQTVGGASPQYVGRYLYSDDDGDSWTLSSNVITSPDNFVKDLGVYITPIFGNDVRLNEQLNFYWTTNALNQVYGITSTDNGSTLGSVFTTGIPSPYATAALTSVNGYQNTIAVANRLFLNYPKIVSRKSIDLLSSADFGKTWSTLYTLDEGQDSSLAFFEPSILYDSLRGNIIIAYSRWTQSWLRSGIICKIIPIKQATINWPWLRSSLALGAQPADINSTGNILQIYNSAIGNTDSYFNFGSSTGNTSKFDPFISTKTHSGDAFGLLIKSIVGSDVTGSYSAGALALNGQNPSGSTLTAMPLLNLANNGSNKFSVGFDGRTEILGSVATSNNTTKRGWLTLPANTASIPSIHLIGSSSVSVSSPAAGDLWYDSSGHVLNFRDNGTTLDIIHPSLTSVVAGTRAGQTTLVSGTKAITITGITTSSLAFVTLVSPSGGSLTIQYQAVCTSNTLTLQANVAAGTINTADGSTLNYFVIN